MNLIEHRFDELSNLEYRVFLGVLEGEHNRTALVLKFTGTYGIGSAGRRDADFMQAITEAALAAWRCDAVIFDLREMAYEWGDDIWRVFGHGLGYSAISDLRQALIVSDLCRGGFSTCGTIVPPMFDDLDTAATFLRDAVNTKWDRLLSDNNEEQ